MFNFCKRLRIRHIRSSPRYPQSNNRIERVHKVLKKMMAASKASGRPFHARLCQVLLQLRTMRHAMTGVTPAGALFKRNIRSLMPTIEPRAKFTSKEWQKTVRMKEDYDRQHQVRDLPPIPPKIPVFIKHASPPDEKYEVKQHTGRKYQVERNDGQIFERNRRDVTVTRSGRLSIPPERFEA